MKTSAVDRATDSTRSTPTIRPPTGAASGKIAHAAIVQRAQANPQNVTPGELLRLQQAYGNRAVSRLLSGPAQAVPENGGSRPTIQTQLSVGAADTPHEREADHVAAQVLRTSPQSQPVVEPAELSHKPVAAQITPLASRAAPNHFTNKIARQASADLSRGFVASRALENRIGANKGNGSPLPSAMRSFMEPRFGADFGGVRVHAGGEAAFLNKQIGAKAFTHRNDIYVRDSTSLSDKSLMAHELTHTIQQGATASQPYQVQRMLTVGGQNIADAAAFVRQPDIATRLRTAGFSVDKAQFIVTAMVQAYDFTLQPDALVALLPKVWDYYQNGVEPVGGDAATAKRLGAIMHQRSLEKKLPKSNLMPGVGSIHSRFNKAQVSDENSIALDKHLTTHPGLVDLIKQHGLKIKLGSTKGAGGQTFSLGQYEAGARTAHVEPAVGGDRREHFMRVLLHEIGHGTFQQELLLAPLEELTNKGKVDSAVLSQTEQGKFSADGMLMFRAWEVLRRNGRQYMFGASMSAADDAQSRQAYQAATFTEFCAESFMHMAVEVSALIAHTTALRQDANTPPEVIRAWADVFGILLKYKGIISKRKWQKAKKGNLAQPQPGARPRLVIGGRTGRGSAGGKMPKPLARPKPAWMVRTQGPQQDNSNH
jgi:hypothetical protein